LSSTDLGCENGNEKTWEDEVVIFITFVIKTYNAQVCLNSSVMHTFPAGENSLHSPHVAPLIPMRSQSATVSHIVKPVGGVVIRESVPFELSIP
jgi:hypothetical protein